MSWGAIGARTTESRVIANWRLASLSPVGFKMVLMARLKSPADAINNAAGARRIASPLRQQMGSFGDVELAATAIAISFCAAVKRQTIARNMLLR